MTRHYFRKAIAPIKPPKKQPIGPGLVVAEGQVMGKRVVRTMTAVQYAIKQGARKGGESGTGHRFTPETASKAGKAAWKTKGRFNKRIGRRLGYPSKRRPQVKREPLRALLAQEPRDGIRFDPESRQWWYRSPTGTAEVKMQERTALRRLGYLPKVTGFVPDKILVNVTRRVNWKPVPEGAVRIVYRPEDK